MVIIPNWRKNIFFIALFRSATVDLHCFLSIPILSQLRFEILELVLEFSNFNFHHHSWWYFPKRVILIEIFLEQKFLMILAYQHK